ncbi:MAG TPA: Rne/Rng family ribonuclease, partial [Candidatus Methylomirabilis sp.]|nr:Rne/Rng family ribonuclease [Candidatus Methylomirabilis sp.]
MKREIIVNSSLVETRVAVIEDGTLVELLIDNTHTQSLAGNIYKGRVLKILPGMQAAFVDIGLTRDAFLYVRDIYEELDDYEHLLSLGEGDGNGEVPDNDVPPPRRQQANRPRRPSHASIEELIQEG